MSTSRTSDISAILSVPLWSACQNGLTDIVSKLLENGADPNIASPNGDTPIVIAVKTGQEQIVLQLMSHTKLKPASLVEAFEASYKLDDSAIKNHLAKVAAPKAANKDGNTRLHIAVKSGDTETIKTLLDAGHDTDLVNDSVETPLQIAIRKEFNAAIRLLVEKNANPLYTQGINSAVVQALWSDDDTAIELLLPAIKNHAKPEQAWFANAVDIMGAMQYKRDVIQRLVKAGIDKNYRNEEGKSIFDSTYDVIAIDNDLIVGPMMTGKPALNCFETKLKEIKFLLDLGFMPSNSQKIVESLADDAARISGKYEARCGALYQEITACLGNGKTISIPAEPAEKPEHKHHHKHKHHDKASEEGMFGKSEKKHHHKHSHKEEAAPTLKK